MYKVTYDNIEINCSSLDEAMRCAKKVNKFVVIQGPDFEVCGVFGVDTVKNGKTPDGVDYTWNKASRIGRVKKNERSDICHQYS
jgi:hypothetical protein